MPQVCCCSMLLTSCVFVTFCVFKCAPLCPSLLFGSCYSSVVPRFFCLSPSCCFTFSTFFHFLFLCVICASIATKKEEKKKMQTRNVKSASSCPRLFFQHYVFLHMCHLSPLLKQILPVFLCSLASPGGVRGLQMHTELQRKSWEACLQTWSSRLRRCSFHMKETC